MNYARSIKLLVVSNQGTVNWFKGSGFMFQVALSKKDRFLG